MQTILTILCIFLFATFLPEIIRQWKAHASVLYSTSKSLWSRLPATSPPTLSTTLWTLLVGVILGFVVSHYVPNIPWPFPPGPTPNPIDPPGPGPKPPTPSVDPIPGTEFRILLLEETSDRHTYTPSQLSILDGTEWKDYLKTKSGQYRVIDKDLTTHPSFQKEEPWVKSAVASFNAIPTDKKQPYPVLLISKGLTGEVIGIGPTMSLQQFTDLVHKYGDK